MVYSYNEIFIKQLKWINYFYLQQQEWVSLTGEAKNKSICTVWHHLHKIPNHVKLIDIFRGQDNGYLWDN